MALLLSLGGYSVSPEYGRCFPSALLLKIASVSEQSLTQMVLLPASMRTSRRRSAGSLTRHGPSFGGIRLCTPLGNPQVQKPSGFQLTRQRLGRPQGDMQRRAMRICLRKRPGLAWKRPAEIVPAPGSSCTV